MVVFSLQDEDLSSSQLIPTNSKMVSCCIHSGIIIAIILLSILAETNHGDQRLPVEGPKEGCQVRQDKEERREHEIQSALLPVSLHFGNH